MQRGYGHKKRRGHSKRLKALIWYRLFGPAPVVPCHWCKKLIRFREATVDHEPPLSDPDGKWYKAVIACKACNHRRNRERQLEENKRKLQRRIMPLTAYRPELPEPPVNIRKLPVDERGYPVPWFVSWVDGKPEFRCADQEKRILAIRYRRCWVCGETIPSGELTFVIGPMCSINRISSEPPCHEECANYSARACPFLTKPHMVRRENDLPTNLAPEIGVMIERNPGVTALWTCLNYQIVPAPGGFLMRMGPAVRVSWWAEGRPASRREVEEAFSTGLPQLQEMAKAEGPLACLELKSLHERALVWLPSEIKAS